MPKIRIRGAELHYEDVGQGPETILFSHGLLFSTRMFDKQVEAFKGRYRCFSYDHRGQGQSETTASGYDMDALTEDAIALIEHFKLGPVHFVGLSMGGFVGMRMAARRPDLVKSLAVLETSAEPEPEKNVPKYRMLAFIGRMFGLGLVANRVMKIMFSQTFLNDPSRVQEREHWKKVLSGLDMKGVSKALEGVVTRKPVLDELSKIRVPTLVGVGDEDVATVPAKAQRIHEGITGSRLAIIKGAGHSSSLEQPEAVNAELEKLFSESRAKSGAA
jgi:pimeloyl-ACP methyl ester carboxylesterase